MNSFRFSPSRFSPLAPTEKEVHAWLSQLKAILAESNRPELANPLLLFDSNEDDVSFALPKSGMLEASELKTSDPELLRQLRYAFRDWRVAAREEVAQTSSDRGFSAEQLDSLMKAENATLFAVKNDSAFQWACCLGFRFNRHADNHLSSLAGSFVPEPEPVPDDPVIDSIHDAAPSKPAHQNPLNTSSPSCPSTPVVATGPWWHGKEHQAALIFSCGFLLAAIFGALFLRSNPCNTANVERQIADMQVQVDQRCSTPQP